jgi:hypothetical protein
MFPTWSWASAKAEEEVNTTGQLLLDWYCTNDVPWPRDVPKIEFRHLKQEDMSMSAFAAKDDGYEQFHPYINLKSWVLKCDVDPDSGDIQVLGSIVP